MSAWALIFAYAAVMAVAVRAFTQEELFAEVRRWLNRRAADGARPLWQRKLAFMPTCDFCLSFWVAVVLLVGVLDFRLAFDDWRGYLVSVLTTMAVANVYLSAFSLLRTDLRRERAAADQVERRRAG